MNEDHPGQEAESRWRRIAHLFDQDHHREHDKVIGDDLGLEGIRATKPSLAGLGLTAALQAVIVVVSGSVALLSDTLHNLGDALTAIPL
jgi:Co/Zn/Cd efflux system component